ncbi:MAG TPA: hypothetical protein VF030_01310, partial [Solirubrobacterales bacterium]
IKNIGDVTATEVTFLQGAWDQIQVHMPGLGRRIVLLPGEEQIYKIRPPTGSTSFAEGDLPLILSYSDNVRSMVSFEILLLIFDCPEEGWRVRNIGSMETIYTRRELKRLTLSATRAWSRPRFLWKARRASIPWLLLHPGVRDALRLELDGKLTRLRQAGEQMRELRERL